MARRMGLIGSVALPARIFRRAGIHEDAVVLSVRAATAGGPQGLMMVRVQRPSPRRGNHRA